MYLSGFIPNNASFALEVYLFDMNIATSVCFNISFSISLHQLVYVFIFSVCLLLGWGEWERFQN